MVYLATEYNLRKSHIRYSAEGREYSNLGHVQVPKFNDVEVLQMFRPLCDLYGSSSLFSLKHKLNNIET